METSLTLLDKAKTAIQKAATVDEVKDIRDRAEALRVYAKQSGESQEIQNGCAEIKLRAERRGGELLRDIDKKKNQHAGSKQQPALSELGIRKTDSHRWQKLASVPEREFENYLHESVESKEEITRTGALRLAKTIRRTERRNGVKASVDGNITSDIGSIVDSKQKFGCVYADPPWKYGNQSTRAATDDHYETLTVDKICELPVSEIVAEEAHLHLWTTNAFLFDAKRVLEAWGFEYRSVFVWVKSQMGIGNYWRVSHEFMLLGVRGGLTFLDRGQTSWMEAPRGRHSAKPEKVRRIIEKVSPGPYLELFGRSEIDGWTVFGNQIDKTLFSKGTTG